jgi:TonB-linked SusC/RagA family outer membrane protein
VDADTYLILSPKAETTTGSTKPATSALPNAEGNQAGDKKLKEDSQQPQVSAFIISGRVINESNEGIPGVNVLLKGTSTGTTTNSEGNYSLSVPDGSGILVFSYIGFTTEEVAIGNRATINITLLPDIKALSEVVVVGYGTQKKATVTGSVSEVKGSEILKSPAPNIANNLAGRVAGVISTNESGEPGADGANILIRGINTFSGATSPLIVVDGVANRPGGFERLNPNDIESITVLKDASAAIYGAQAANGVILVTTKRGKTGKPQLNFSYNQGLNSWIKIPRFTNAAEYAELVNEAQIYAGQSPIYTAEDIQKFGNGSNPITHPNTNWANEVVRQVTPQYRANISLSGGTERATYYASYGRLGQEGQFKNSNLFGYTQNNLALNFDAQVVDNLKVSVDVQLRDQDRNGPAGSTTNSFNGTGSDGSFNVFTGLFASLPIYPARFPDGRLGATNGAVNSFLNPLATTTGLAGEAKFKDLFALNTFRYKLEMPWLVEGLFLDGFVSADLQNSNTKDFKKSWSVYRFDPQTQEYIEERQSLSSEGLATLDQSTFSSRLITLNTKLNYTTIVANVHSINAFLAYEQQQFKSDFFYASRRNFFSDNIAELDYGSPNNAINGGNSSNTARRNFFGRINYAFREKYLLEVQARYDGSDKFPQDRRWGLFPSVSLGWRISAEEWANKLLRNNDLKIRASWGRLGNDAIAPYQFLQFYNLNSSGYVLNGRLVPTLTPGVLPNPNFTWETAESINLGVDGSLFNKHLTYNFEVFNQQRSDVLTQRNATIPLYTGLILPVENIGKVRNRGFEGQLNYRKTYNNFTYFIGTNFTYARNKVLFVDEPASIPDYQKRTGRPINSDLFYVAKGLFQSQSDIDAYPQYNTGQIPRPGDVIFEDVNGDEKIDFLDMVRLDLNSTPEIVYGVNTGFEWKGFDLSVLFQGQARSMVYFYPQSSSIINFYHFLYEGRSTPNKVTDKPSTAGDFFNRPQFNSNTLPFFRRNTSFLRLKNIEAGYTFSNQLLGRLRLSQARIYVNASNLLTFAQFNDVDPESLNRLDGKGYPVLRTVNLGINVSF